MLKRCFTWLAKGSSCGPGLVYTENSSSATPCACVKKPGWRKVRSKGRETAWVYRRGVQVQRANVWIPPQAITVWPEQRQRGNGKHWPHITSKWVGHVLYKTRFLAELTGMLIEFFFFCNGSVLNTACQNMYPHYTGERTRWQLPPYKL